MFHARLLAEIMAILSISIHFLLQISIAVSSIVKLASSMTSIQQLMKCSSWFCESSDYNCMHSQPRDTVSAGSGAQASHCCYKQYVIKIPNFTLVLQQYLLQYYNIYLSTIISTVVLYCHHLLCYSTLSLNFRKVYRGIRLDEYPNATTY